MKRIKIVFTTNQVATIEEALQMLEADYDQACDGEFGDQDKRTPTSRKVFRKIASVRKTIMRHENKVGK